VRVSHSLDPFTPEEITAAIEIIRSHHQLSERARYRNE
jgi:Cu2+-containing amine oxidase